MSAPRKIWVPMPVTDEGPCYVDKDEAEMQWGCTAVAYHHDDVVRELVEELQAALSYFDHHGITGGSVETTRAALAKIAQEG